MAKQTKRKVQEPAADTAASPLAPVEAAAKTYADAHAALAAQVAAVDEKVAFIYRRYAATVHALAVAEAKAKLDLIKAVDANRRLFGKPKSRVLFGVKVGLRKGQDVLNLGDEDRLIARIRNLFPDMVAQLVKESASVIKAGIKTLERDDLQRLGVNYVEGADEPFATIETSDAAKAAQAILDSLKE